MSSLIDRIRHEFATTSAVRQAGERWGELQEEHDRYPCHSAERRVVGAEIASCLDVIAHGIIQSRLASLVGFIGDPDDLRRDMAGWRNGDDMSGEEFCPHGY